MREVKDGQILFNNLVNYAKAATKSGHPYLDNRYETEPKSRRPYYRFCQELVRQVEPKLVVELGIDEGDCCGHWASGSANTQVLGVDVHKDNEYPADRCKDVEKQFSNFKYLRGWTWARVNDVKAYGSIDILYIDSWHEYPYAAYDFNLYAPLLADNHIVLIDDLHFGANESPPGGVLKFFNEIPAKQKFVDHTMNPAVPFGMLVGINKNYKFKFSKKDYPDLEWLLPCENQ